LAELKPASFWARLLKLVDDELTEPHDLVIVGGAAIGLRYAATHPRLPARRPSSPERGSERGWR
jgi:hypothetical protein